MLDSNVSTYIDKDGNVQEVGSGGSEYANTSEIVDNAITLTSTSTLADLATQILAQKTKVCRVSSYGGNTADTLARLYELFNVSNAYDAPSYTFEYFFKVLSSDDYIELECSGGGAAAFFRGGITRYYHGSAVPPYGAWQAIPLIQYANPYPVGSIYISASSATPGSLFGGTWERIKDVFLLSAGDTYHAGLTGGEATHTLTVEEMPAHGHDSRDLGINWSSGNFQYLAQYSNEGSPKGRALTTTDTGGGKSHNNMPPYLTVYMWKRIA